MIGFSHWDEFLIVSALLCTVIHWIGLMVSDDIRLLNSHDFTKLLYCMVFQLWKKYWVYAKVCSDFDIQPMRS